MLRIAVLMACFNRREKTLACLRNVFLQKGLNEEFITDVYLVDDASTDGTSATVAAEFPQVHIIHGSGKLFWNRGMHTAWKVAAAHSYDYYLWLNDDTMIYSHAIQEMIIAAGGINDNAVICGTIESPEKIGTTSYGGAVFVNNSYRLNYPSGELLPCDVINGNCVLVPKMVFEKVGNLDWNFIHAIGDNDYAMRAKKAAFLVLSTGSFIGSCARNPTLPNWCLPNVPFLKRIKSLYSPLGNSQPFRYFIYEQRHFGLLVAIKHFISIHIRVLVPTLWK